MEPIPVRAIAIQDVRPVSLDSEAVDAALIGTARFAIWIGATFTFTAIALTISYQLIPASVRGRGVMGVFEVSGIVMTTLGGLAIAAGGLLMYRRHRAAVLTINCGAAAVLCSHLGIMALYLAKSLNNSQSVLARSSLAYAHGWVREFGTLMPVLGCLLLAVTVRRVIGVRGSEKAFQPIADAWATLSYSNETYLEGERVEKRVSATLFGLTLGLAVLYAGGLGLSVMQGSLQYVFLHPILTLRIGVYCAVIPIFLMVAAGVVYLLGKRYTVWLLLASGLLITAQVLSAVYQVQLYRPYFRTNRAPTWETYLYAGIVADALIKVMIPSANFVWFTRRVVRRVITVGR